jgi:hypothetical protein
LTVNPNDVPDDALDMDIRTVSPAFKGMVLAIVAATD